MNDYKQQAIDFCIKHNVKMSFIGEPEYRKHFADDKVSRYVFKIKLTRNKKSYTFDFGQSIAEGSNEPDLYSVLTCLTKYDPNSFEDFCGDFSYDSDSRKSEKIYKAVCKEWQAVERLFGDILEELQEIA